MPTCNIPTSKPITTLFSDSTTQYRISPGSNSNQCIVTRAEPPCQQTLNIPCKQIIIQPTSAESTDMDRLPASTVTPGLGAAETPKPLEPNAGGGGLQAGDSQPTAGGTPTEGAQPGNGAGASSSSSSSVPLAAVVGGAVGGVVLLLVLVALFVCMRRRKARARRGRGRDRYVVQLKSEPDFNEQDEKPYQEGPSPSASPSSLPRPLSLPRSSLPPPAAVARSMAPVMAMDGREGQLGGHHAYQQQQQQQQPQPLQHQVRPQSPLPLAQQHQRATSPTGPGPVAMSPVEYTPKSTYIGSSPSLVKEPHSGHQPTPSIQSAQPDSEQQDNTYIDLIPVEDTPQISHASLPLPLSAREGGSPRPLHRHDEEQHGEYDSKEQGQEQQGLLRSGAGEASHQGALSKTAAAALDQDDDDDDDEEIKYL
ncbi:hypothetical protein KVV02_000630 [Mortierella alpina]|uniref:Uncharacterized protein n=1 Tax=Mortierella alpina TaxID=64518 RepID=A0A9P8AA15_MORAP|nr:hypothetical protein KVV02_000630 [Mortierella alpina]